MHSDFRYSEQITPDQAAVQPTPEKNRKITLSGTHNHADADTGMDGGHRMRVSYLRQFVAILCRLADALTSRLSRTPMKASDVFLGDAKISASALIFRSLMPIRFCISWFSLAPMSTTRFVVAQSSKPCHHEMRAQRRNAPSPVGAA